MTSPSSLSSRMERLSIDARAAKAVLAALDSAAKERALLGVADALDQAAPQILAANEEDMTRAAQNGLSASMLDRLKLSPERIRAMSDGVRMVARFPDPTGQVLEDRVNPANGLRIRRVSVPLGVIGVIYESRPNVTADAAALCFKSGNVCLLRGGSESAGSSRAIYEAIRRGLREAGAPENAVLMAPDTDRAFVGEMLTATGVLDLVIPRGGKSLCARVQAESRVPTLLHLEGICHTYIHAKADHDKAVAILLNAKMRRTGVCGSTETLLIDRAIAAELGPHLAAALLDKGCEIRADADALPHFQGSIAAAPEDFGKEFLDAVLAVKTVQNVEEAVTFIARHGSSHTECIVTEDALAADYFLTRTDSAIVMHNASTQFADGGEFGLGAEIGIATGKLHARGPVGAGQLVTYKYVVTAECGLRACS